MLPPPTLVRDLLAMLTDEQYSDLTIEAEYDGEPPVRFPVHACVLSRRSAVFCAALSHGTREAASRRIRLVDTPPLVLKALLHYLYSDDFAEVERVLREAVEAGGRDAAAGAAAVPQATAEQRMAQLQALLAVAHKYQVGRLLCWSEQQLCRLVRAESVCSLVELARVYDASELLQHCLRFMKAHQAQVVARADFAALTPQSLVRFNMFCAGVEPPSDDSRKRKRDAA